MMRRAALIAGLGAAVAWWGLATAAHAQAPTPAPPEPAPQEPGPKPAPANPAPQEPGGKPDPTPGAGADPTPAGKPDTPPGTPGGPSADPQPAAPAPPPEDARSKRARFELLDLSKAPRAGPMTSLGYPVLLSPKALGYVAMYPVVRLGRDGDFGTRVRLDPVFGLDNYEVGAPAILVDVQTDLGGWSNILRFQYQDSEIRGSDAVRTDFRYDRTLFLQGTVVDAVFSIADVELKLLQRLGDWGAFEVWAMAGGHYTRTSTRLRAPATSQRESNIMDLPQFVAGGRLAWTPARWFSVFAELDGMAWKVHGVRSASLRGAAGLEIRVGGGWGVVLSYTATYIEAVATGDNRDELRYLAYGPRLAILAGL